MSETIRELELGLLNEQMVDDSMNEKGKERRGFMKVGLALLGIGAVEGPLGVAEAVAGGKKAKIKAPVGIEVLFTDPNLEAICHAYYKATKGDKEGVKKYLGLNNQYYGNGIKLKPEFRQHPGVPFVLSFIEPEPCNFYLGSWGGRISKLDPMMYYCVGTKNFVSKHFRNGEAKNSARYIHQPLIAAFIAAGGIKENNNYDAYNIFARGGNMQNEILGRLKFSGNNKLIAEWALSMLIADVKSEPKNREIYAKIQRKNGFKQLV